MRLYSIHIERPRARFILLFSACALLGALMCALAFASPSRGATLAQKQAQAAELGREVGKLEDRYGALQERYRGAQIRLRHLARELVERRNDLADTRMRLDAAQQRLEQRAVVIYQRGGGDSAFLAFARAGSIDDLVTQIDTIQRVSGQDQQLLDDVRTLNRRVADQERRVRDARDEQSKVVARAKADRAEMGAVLRSRQARLASVNGEIRAMMLAQQRAAQAEAERQARSSVSRFQASGGAGRDSVPSVVTSPSGGGATDTGGEGTANSAPEPSSSSSFPSSSAPLPPASGTAAAAAGIAMGKVGAPYSYGAAGPSRFDCSGLVVWAFAQAGRAGLPHSTYSLIGMGVEVPRSQMQVGDLVFTNNSGHMGIYVGGGSMVHAPRTGRPVTVESLSYYSIVSVRRI